ncbi:diguanylate cyclase [Alcanivorax hongdengensis A-11-3]|uniref:diguanylate cyclase n=1 Tax=Alcanivorax hongdengensis A-11-3 TaxID=1177179 RepID=L0W7P1_9GAMM|nr:diguanylate cyclase [Alcanivorax hongdengensis A-11-3]
MRRQMMAIYSYLLLWLGVYLGVELSAFDPNTPHLQLFGGLFAINIVFYLMIRFGLSDRLRDPSLTVAQMVVGVAFITVILYFARELRGAMLSIYFMVMTFGVFALSRRQMVLMALFTMVCFTLLEFYDWHESPETVLFTYLFGHWLILLLELAWFVYIGGYIHNLQVRVREQRESLKDAHDRLTAIAVRDDLTGLYNRRHFLERLDEELALSDRKNTALHLAIIDLDHFKQVNDRYGHQAGDEVLRRFADIAQATLRRSDLLARYGGEEFVVLFPQSSGEECMAALERLRRQIAGQRYEFAPDLSTTFSAGLVDYRRGETAAQLGKRADMALYEAKGAGRNQVVHNS